MKLLDKNELVNDRTMFDIISKGRVSFSDLRLMILDQEFTITFNLPWINTISLPSVIYESYYLYPGKIDFQCAMPKQTKFQWFTKLPDVICIIFYL